jgi:HlyD family secretion protein
MKNLNLKSRKILIPAVVILILILAGGGYYFWRQQQTKTTSTQTTTTFYTAPVTRGSLTVSATGTGSLVPSQVYNLGFGTSGTVATVNVQPGDRVKAGQELATEQDVAVLQAAANLAQSNLVTSQQALDTFRSNADSNLGNAQLALSNAQKAVYDAKKAVKNKGMTRCDDLVTQAYYNTYIRLKGQLDKMIGNPLDSGYYLNEYVPFKNTVAQAYATYLYCANYTSFEIDASHANMSLAEAAVKTAQTNLDTLKANKGLDPVGLAQAQNAVDNANLAYEKAKQNLDGATIKAPIDGIVMDVAGQVGDSVGTGTFISVSDLDHPQVQFFVDETDMDKVALGNEVQVTFDAISNKTFKAKVIRIYPTLVTTSNYPTLQGLAQIDLSSETKTYNFASGMNASVEVISGSAQNALLVPLEAVRNLGDEEFGVFVLNAQGQPRLRIVEVGLKDTTRAEIKSGLQLGDVVTTGNTNTR